MAKVLQVPIDEKLAARLKAKVNALGVSQGQFVIGLIVAALDKRAPNPGAAEAEK